MPKLKIRQFCAILIRKKCAKFQVFLKLSTWVSQPAKYAQNDIFGPRTHFGLHLLNYSRSNPNETGFSPDISW